MKTLMSLTLLGLLAASVAHADNFTEKNTDKAKAIIDAAVEDLGIAREKVLVNLDRYGNTSAASMPLVLDEAQQAGHLKPGDRILLCGFGGGLAWGAGVFQF